MKVPDIVFKKKSALLDFFQQVPDRENGLVHGLEAAQALHCRQRHHGIDAYGVDNFVIFIDRNEVDRSVQNPRGHIVGHDAVPGLAQSPVEMTLQRTPHGVVASERLWQLPPGFFEVLLSGFQHLFQILLHTSSLSPLDHPARFLTVHFLKVL
jgi:hypothetical protein